MVEDAMGRKVNFGSVLSSTMVTEICPHRKPLHKGQSKPTDSNRTTAAEGVDTTFLLSPTVAPFYSEQRHLYVSGDYIEDLTYDNLRIYERETLSANALHENRDRTVEVSQRRGSPW
jgi:hypothetical protein